MVKHLLRRYWVLFVSSFIALTVTFQTIFLSIDLNDGQYIYGLDDAYIHMSIASNFAEHGTWGVTQYEYTSATSSPLWTSLLALVYSLFGVHDLTPLLLNLALALCLLLVADWILHTYSVSSLYRLGVLVILIITLPLNTLIMIGMEHVLHGLLALDFIQHASTSVTQESHTQRSWHSIRLLILGLLLGSARYEGLFIVGYFCFVLLLQRRVLQAIMLGVMSIIPILIYGLIALDHGWEFLPTSLILKSNSNANLSSITSLHALRIFFIDDTWNVFNGGHMLFVPILASICVIWWRFERTQKLMDANLIALLAVVVVILMNVRMVSYPHDGTFARYETYLITLWMVFTVSALSDILPRRLQRQQFVSYIFVAIVIAFVTKGIWQRYIFLAYRRPVVTATENIYQQQIQMARFLQTYYDDMTVGANDIGAISYFTDIHLVDLYGLATIEVARAKIDGSYDTNAIRQIVHDKKVQIAIVYDPWFIDYGGLPEEWIWVGQWEVTNNVMLGYHQISFYAINQDQAAQLADNLRDYSATLPDSVIERGIYVSKDVLSP